MTTRVCLERTIPHYDDTGLETPWLSAAPLERRISHYDDTGLLGAVCETEIPLMNSICLQDRFFVSGAAVVLLTSKRGAGVQKHACRISPRAPHWCWLASLLQL